MNRLINIRQYNAEDKQAVVDMLRNNTPLYFAPDEEADFLNYLDHHLEYYFVIEYEGVVAGCGGYNLFHDHAKISWDIINPDYQHKGLGRSLLQYRINRLIEQHEIKNIVVRTSQFVYPFYQKNGFILDEVKSDYWAKGYDLYKLVLKI